MNILALTDIHGHSEELRKILNSIDQPIDLVLIAGDITNFGNYNKIKEIISLFESFRKPYYYVPGNCDYINEFKEDVNKNNLHGKYIKFYDYIILGIGGSTRTPFNTAFELEEKEIKEIILKTYSNIKENYKKLILLSHSPPYDCKVDTTKTGRKAGSKSIREFIEKYSPDLVICGHVHEAKGIDKIGKTLIVNPGPAMYNNYSLIYVNDDIKISLKYEE